VKKNKNNNNKKKKFNKNRVKINKNRVKLRGTKGFKMWKRVEMIAVTMKPVIWGSKPTILGDLNLLRHRKKTRDYKLLL